MKRIYVFPSGARIDLRRVVCIGALDKNINSGYFFIAIYMMGMDKPILFDVGYAIGKVSEETKSEILSTVENFRIAWEQYIIFKEQGIFNQ